MSSFDHGDGGERRRRAIDLLPTDCQIDSEKAAFDVVVAGTGLIGRWVLIEDELDGGREYGVVTWTNGTRFETAPFDAGDRDGIVEAVERTVPGGEASGSEPSAGDPAMTESGKPHLAIVPGAAEAIGTAISHPIRVSFLKLVNDQSITPVKAAAALDESLGVVSYHVNTLKKLGCLTLTRTEQRRGAMAHYFTTTDLGKEALALIDLAEDGDALEAAGALVEIREVRGGEDSAK